MPSQDVTISQAFQALWPILTAVGGGYGVLLGIVYKLLTDANARTEKQHERELTELRRQVTRLETQNDQLQGTVKEFQRPLEKVADTSEEMNRTLEQMLDGIFPRGPARGR